MLRTNQEDGQLKLVIEHHSVNTAWSTEPGCDLVHEVSVKDEKEDSRAWNKMYMDRDRKRRTDKNGESPKVIVTEVTKIIVGF